MNSVGRDYRETETRFIVKQKRQTTSVHARMYPLLRLIELSTGLFTVYALD
jgi:hypothetical protein